MSFFAAILDRYVLDRPWLALAVLAIVAGVLAIFVPRFELDASADSLLLEQDADLRYYRSIVARYGSDNFLVVTYTARRDLFSATTLADLTDLRDELFAMTRVRQVISMLDVPLIETPGTSLATLQKNVPTLESPTTDPQRARAELRNSPIYSNLLMSLDGDTTALLVRFRENEEYVGLQAERDRLREKMLAGRLDPDESRAKNLMTERINELSRMMKDQEQADIAEMEVLAAQLEGLGTPEGQQQANQLTHSKRIEPILSGLRQLQSRSENFESVGLNLGTHQSAHQLHQQNDPLARNHGLYFRNMLGEWAIDNPNLCAGHKIIRHLQAPVDISARTQGQHQIRWYLRRMPVLQSYKTR